MLASSRMIDENSPERVTGICWWTLKLPPALTVFSSNLLKIILINVFLLSIQNTMHLYINITISRYGSSLLWRKNNIIGYHHWKWLQTCTRASFPPRIIRDKKSEEQILRGKRRHELHNAEKTIWIRLGNSYKCFFVAQSISGKSRYVKCWVMALVRLRGEQAQNDIEWQNKMSVKSRRQRGYSVSRGVNNEC